MENKISVGTVVRTILLLISAVNIVLMKFGVNPLNIPESTVTEIAELAVILVPVIWAWWKNNSFSEKARAADKYLHNLKDLD